MEPTEIPPELSGWGKSNSYVHLLVKLIINLLMMTVSVCSQLYCDVTMKVEITNSKQKEQYSDIISYHILSKSSSFVGIAHISGNSIDVN